MQFGVFDLRMSKMRGCNITFEILSLVSVTFIVGCLNEFGGVAFTWVVYTR